MASPRESAWSQMTNVLLNTNDGESDFTLIMKFKQGEVGGDGLTRQQRHLGDFRSLLKSSRVFYKRHAPPEVWSGLQPSGCRDTVGHKC